MGTKNNPGDFDCYNDADPDEPMFILLARDKHAPTLVWLWATLRELDGEDPQKVQEARDCVSSMLSFAAKNNRPSVGLGQATLAGCMELVRVANQGVENAKNIGTQDDLMRLFLGKTTFENEGTK